jgi:hypothetical protein
MIAFGLLGDARYRPKGDEGMDGVGHDHEYGCGG